MTGIPRPVNEPNLSYLPGSAERAELKDALRQMASERIDIPVIIGGREIRTGRTEGGDAARPCARARRLACGGRGARAAGDRERRRRAARVGVVAWHERAAVFLRAAELLTTTWRATVNAATMLGQSKTAFQAEIDAASRADRLLAIQSASTRRALCRAADQQPRGVEPARVPSARRVRLRGHALQLHVDCRQPADGAGADGQHGDLEAGVERDAQRLLHDAAARGGGPARRRHQFRAGRSGGDLERAARLTRSRRRPFHRQHGGVQHACGRRSARTCGAISSPIRASSAKRAARISSSRTRPPTRRSWRWRIARGGFEYQGQKCSAASRVYVPRSLWPEVRDRVVGDDARDARWATSPTSAPSSARSSTRRHSRGSAATLEDAKRNANDHRRAARHDERGVTSSNRR